MDIIRSAILLFLLQLSPLDVLMTGEAAASVYKCAEKQTSDQTVTSPGAQLTKGCVLDDNGITFDLSKMYKTFDIGAMYETPSIPAVVIDITEAAFINSSIKLINAHIIDGQIKNAVPLQFTMSKSKMTGTSNMEFGDDDQVEKGKWFKLAPHSRIRILHCELNITPKQFGIFTLYSLQLVTNSSIEIAHNVIAMEHTSHMTVFFLPKGTDMMVYEGSSFTLLDNEIHINAHTGVDNISYKIHTRIWCQAHNAALTIAKNSIYTWTSNNISIVGHNVNGITQYVWHHSPKSSLHITDSVYTWLSNNITIVGYKINVVLFQSIWRNHDAILFISNSKYTLKGNLMNMIVYDVTGDVFQYVWMALSRVIISKASQFLLDSNRMLLLANDYGTIHSSVMMITAAIGLISGNSSMAWKDNCVGMVQKKGDKRHVFGGNWSITQKGKLQFDGNYFTTTAEYEPNGSEQTELVWGPKGDTTMAINDGTLSIGNIQVHGNSVTDGATDSVVWKSSASIHKTDVKQPAMDWSSSPAKDKSGALIPLLDNSNLRQYMCVGLPNIPPAGTIKSPPEIKPHVISTIKTAVKSATAISSTIPAVLISSVVFLYLYN